MIEQEDIVRIKSCEGLPTGSCTVVVIRTPDGFDYCHSSFGKLEL